MNSLSWFLYWIDVVSGLNTAFGIASILFIIAILATWIVHGMGLEESRNRDRIDNIRAARSGWTWRFAILAAVCGVTASFLPSKGTMYAIAASQVGEKVAASEAVQGIASDATKALQQWIKKQIEPEKKS